MIVDALDAQTRLEQVHAEYLAAREATKTSLDRHNARVEKIYGIPVVGPLLYVLNMFTGDPIEEFRPWVEKYHKLLSQEEALHGLAEHYASQVAGTYPFRSLAITEFGRNFEIKIYYDNPEKEIHLAPTLVVERFIKEWSPSEKPSVGVQKDHSPILYLPMETKGIPLIERVVGMGSADRFTRYPVWIPNLRRRVEMLTPNSIRSQLHYN